MPDESIDCIVTSPPYWGLRDYGVPTVVFGGEQSCQHAWGPVTKKSGNGSTEAEMKGNTLSTTSATRRPHHSQLCSQCGAWCGQLGLEPTFDMFLAHLLEVFGECFRVLKPSGTMWVNMGDSYYTGAGTARKPGGGSQGKEFHGPQTQPNRLAGSVDLPRKSLIGQPWRLAIALQESRWTLRSDIIWHKPNPMPESAKDRPTCAHEHLFLFSKTGRYWYDARAIAEPIADATIQRINQANGPRFGGSKYADSEDIKHRTKSGNVYGENLKDPKKKPVGGGAGSHAEIDHDLSKNEASHRLGRAPGWRKDPQPLTRNTRNVWTIPVSPYPEAHFATFPKEIPRRCILAGCPEGGTVLDPFAGSGTTLAVALTLNRMAIGIELNSEYCELIRKRVNKALSEMLAHTPDLDFEEH